MPLASTSTPSLLRLCIPPRFHSAVRFSPSSSSLSSLPQPFQLGGAGAIIATGRTRTHYYRFCSTTSNSKSISSTTTGLGKGTQASTITTRLSSSSTSTSTSITSSSSSSSPTQGELDSKQEEATNMPEKGWTEARVPPTPSELLETNRQWHADADPEMFASLSKGQKPAIAWIGCSDSRVPAELVTGAAPGDLFVHRNIANTFNPKDPSALAFLAYAVNALGVSHVIVCGHKNCGGVQAALASAKERQANNIAVDEGTEAIQNWLTPLRALAVANLRTSSSFAAEVDPTKSLHALVEQNVCAQVSNVASCSVVKNAWRQGKSLTIHGWVYDLSTGKIEDLKVSEGTGITDTKI